MHCGVNLNAVMAVAFCNVGLKPGFYCDHASSFEADRHYTVTTSAFGLQIKRTFTIRTDLLLLKGTYTNQKEPPINNWRGLTNQTRPSIIKWVLYQSNWTTIK